MDQKVMFMIMFLCLFLLGAAIKVNNKYWIKATAYIARGKTASGKKHPNGIASNFLRVGSTVRISQRISRGSFPDGFDHTRIFIVDDCMGEVNKNIQTLDFRLKHHSNAKKFGVATLEVEVLSIGNGRKCF